MKGIILAAGQGTRLRPLTDRCPKCLVELHGMSLLERQTRALRLAGVTDIIVVAGYRAEMIVERGYPTILNRDFDSTNMVSTLFCARDFLSGDDDVIISYGDIVCEPRVVGDLIAGDEPVCVTVDTEWRRYWELRMSDPLADAETLKLTPEGYIRELGKKPRGYGDIEGQYMGLIKAQAAHVGQLLKTYDAMDRSASYDGKDFRNMYMTSFLQYLIDAGWPVKAILVQNGWLEVDTVADLDLYRAMIREGRLHSFYDHEAVAKVAH